MQRATLNYIIDLGLFISFLSVSVTGILKYPGLVQNLGISYRDIPFNVITPLHDASGVVMTVLVLVHLVLHWGWIVGMTKNFFKKK
ncbi:MAG: DUF4405 domain-containing protein [bacterium]|nr:DUF4405 domain-containing protein [bacterium]